MTDNNSFVGSYNYINNNINDASPRSLGGSILASIGGNSNFNNNFNNSTITNPNTSTVTLGLAAVGAISASDMSIVFSSHALDSIQMTTGIGTVAYMAPEYNGKCECGRIEGI